MADLWLVDALENTRFSAEQRDAVSAMAASVSRADFELELLRAMQVRCPHGAVRAMPEFQGHGKWQGLLIEGRDYIVSNGGYPRRPIPALTQRGLIVAAVLDDGEFGDLFRHWARWLFKPAGRVRIGYPPEFECRDGAALASLVYRDFAKVVMHSQG